MFYIFAFVVFSAALYLLGWQYAAGVLVAVVIIYKFILFNTKRISARNAVYGALTFSRLTSEQQRQVDNQVSAILARGRLGIDALGPPYPGSEKSSLSSMSNPAVVFAFRSLAMHELGIPPVGTKVSKWYVLRNPFTTKLAGEAVNKYRQRVERDFGVTLNELN